MRWLFRLVILTAITFLIVPAAAADDRLKIGPIPGFTSAWHRIPENLSIPIDAAMTLQFKARIPRPGKISWIGATETSAGEEWSFAECPLEHAGRHVVGIDRVLPTGETVEFARAALDFVAIDPEQISFQTEAWVDPVVIDGGDPGASTYAYFRGESIAGLRQLSDSPEATYLTSIGRWVHLRARVTPRALRELIEWRAEDGQSYLGSRWRRRGRHPGTERVSIGPPDDPQVVTLETYSVEITSHVSNHDVIATGLPVTFTAVTDPPGYEDGITWLASTKYGSSGHRRRDAGLPDEDFLRMEYEYDGNRNPTLARYGEAVEGRQPTSARVAVWRAALGAGMEKHDAACFAKLLCGRPTAHDVHLLIVFPAGHAMGMVRGSGRQGSDP